MNWNDVRNDFPLIIKHPKIAYLDSAATSQRPASVIEAEQEFYVNYNANPLRGLYDLSQEATERYETARQRISEFIGAGDPAQIIFTRNSTESLNLLAYSLGATLSSGDEILVSIMEHHSNIVPWQQVCKRTGASLKFVECDEQGVITKEAFEACLTDKTRIVSMTQVSNVLGVKNDIKLFASLAHEKGALFICDGAQSVPHMPVDVADLDVDFLVFSGHKMGAPFGIGVLYGRYELLNDMQPFLTGGEMIEFVTREDATWAEVPHKFEAGTVNAAGAYGLLAAIDYYRSIGFENIVKREEELSQIAFRLLTDIPHVKLLGSKDANNHNGIFSFTVEGVHPHDIAEILNSDGVCIRAGHHCAQPLLKHLGVSSSARASLMFYNTEDEIVKLAESLKSIRRRMGYAE
ncbi:MAG: cysteine desulfurase [Clostridiales bacterium]|nr:cysteine desulfurase [Clostridiales bacterium]